MGQINSVGASNIPADIPSPKLAKAAQEFEAILLTQWLEKIQQTFAGSDEAADPAQGTLASMGTQAIASALAARGGIGIASMLLRQLKSTGSESTVDGSAATQQGTGEERPKLH